MAELTWEGNELVLRLGRFERVEAVHGDLRIPGSSVRGAEIIDDALDAVHGARAPGTGLPGVVAVGTYRLGGGKKSFAVVHHDTPRGVRVALQGTEFDELVVGCADPEAVLRTLRLDGHAG